MDPLQVRDRLFRWGDRTYLMGVLNVTPDSFSDGGDHYTLEAALTQARQMVNAGADMLDIGGQSTRPNAEDVPLEEECRRTIPVIQAIRQECSVPISIDTMKAEVARAAVAAGADMVNDVTGGCQDPDMLPAIAEMGVPAILMHMRGTPKTMQQLTDYEDLIGEIQQYLQERVEAALGAGISQPQLILDPGIGFAKTYEQNLEILRRLPDLRVMDLPLLVGVSRKSFIGKILDRPNPKERVWGTAAACTAAIAGKADILRVHDVAPLWDVCRVADAIYRLASG